MDAQDLESLLWRLVGSAWLTRRRLKHGVWTFDVTARKAAEAAMRESEMLLRQTPDTMSDGLFTVDQDLRYQVFNGNYVQFSDLPDGAVQVGKTVEEAVRHRGLRGDYGPGDGPGDPDDLVAEQLIGYHDRGLARLADHLPDGWILEVRRGPLEDGVVCTFNDITERKVAEEELRTQKQLLRNIIDNLTRGVMALDADPNLITSNKRLKEMREDQGLAPNLLEPAAPMRA